MASSCIFRAEQSTAVNRAVLCMPPRGSSYIPVRALSDHDGYQSYAPDSTRVLAAAAAAVRQPRLVIRFPEGFCPGIKAFDADGGAAAANYSLPFGVYDALTGLTVEQTRVLANVDALATALAQACLECPLLRTAVGLCGAATDAPNDLGLCVVRPSHPDPSPTTVNSSDPKNTTDVLDGGRARFGFFRILEQATGGSPPTQWYTPQDSVLGCAYVAVLPRGTVRRGGGSHGKK